MLSKHLAPWQISKVLSEYVHDRWNGRLEQMRLVQLADLDAMVGAHVQVDVITSAGNKNKDFLQLKNPKQESQKKPNLLIVGFFQRITYSRVFKLDFFHIACPMFGVTKCFVHLFCKIKKTNLKNIISLDVPIQKKPFPYPTKYLFLLSCMPFWRIPTN